MERVKLSKIKENGKNPRLIRDTQFNKLVKSLLVFPRMLELRPIVVDSNNIVLGGNMRLKALKHIAKLSVGNIATIVATDDRFNEEQRKAICVYWTEWQKQKDAPVVKADDLTEEQKREFIIKDNSGFGEWDFNALGNEWSDLPLIDWSVPAWNTEVVNPFMGDEQPTAESSEDVGNGEINPDDLPPELQGRDITPAELPKLEGSDETARERIIIVYKPDDAAYLAALLGLTGLDKVVYSVEELKEKNGSE